MLAFFESLRGRDCGVRVTRSRDLAPPLGETMLDRLVGMLDPGDEVTAALRRFVAVHERLPLLPLVLVTCCARSLTRSETHALAPLGLRGVVNLTMRPAEVLTALQHAREGRVVVNFTYYFGPAGERDGAAHLELPADVAAEAALLRLLARGHTDAEIGLALSLSAHTVHHHIGRLNERLGVRNRAELAALAGSLGLYRPAASSPSAVGAPGFARKAAGAAAEPSGRNWPATGRN